MSGPAGVPSADAVAVAAGEEDVPIRMGVGGAEEELVFRVGSRTLLLSAAALIYALAVAGVDPTHLLLLFLLWALALALVYASTADLRRLPRGVAAAAVAVARALHRLFWEQRQ